MTYIPNPEKPGEISMIRQAVDDLILCRQSGGGWDLSRLDRWLQQYPLRMADAIDTLDAVMDDHYPPVVQGGVQHDQRSSDRLHDYRSA